MKIQNAHSRCKTSKACLRGRMIKFPVDRPRGAQHVVREPVGVCAWTRRLFAQRPGGGAASVMWVIELIWRSVHWIPLDSNYFFSSFVEGRSDPWA